MTFRRFVNATSRVAVCLALVGGVLFAAVAPANAAYDDAGVLHYGAAPTFGKPTTAKYDAPVVGMAATPDGQGYWLTTADGAVTALGDAVRYGDESHTKLFAPIGGIVATADGKGYWLWGINGQLYPFGDAGNFGSAHGVNLHGQIVGMAATYDGQGYWMLSSSGMVRAYGDAVYAGQMYGAKVGSVVGIVASPTSYAYWLFTASGGVYTFGGAGYFGSEGKAHIPAWIASMAVTPDGKGYWLANANGAVYAFGDAKYLGDNAKSARTEPIQQIVSDPAAAGYWLLEPDAFPTAFDMGLEPDRVIETAEVQIHADPDTGYFCNPYGPCEAWCALFATWVWRHSGIDIPQYAFVGYIYDWARTHTRVLSPSTVPRPGDIVLYGTGPSTVNTAVHTGIVAQVWPDGAIDTIEGDSGPAADGAYNVTINGPFVPSQSEYWNGTPIFGFAAP